MTPAIGGAVAPFRPRPLACPAALSPLLALPSWQFLAEDRPVALSLQAWSGAGAADEDDGLRWLDWTLGDGAGALGLPRWLLDAVLRSVEPAARREPDGEIAAMLVELALQATLGHLEMALGQAVQLRHLRDAPPAPDAARIRLGCAGLYDGDPFEAVLLLPQDALQPLLSAGRSRAAPRAEPRLVQAIRIGRAVLDVRTVSSLGVGDAVVLQRPEAGRAVLVCGEHLATTVLVADGRATLDGPLRPAKTLALEDWTMPEIDGGAVPDGGLEPEDASLDALQVTLVFELGRRAVTLQDARALTAGTVIELGPVAQQRVSVLAGGRRIAEGELVQVGEAMAVRLARINAG